MSDKDDENVYHSDVLNENTVAPIFSARIVTVDHYLSYPTTEYDTCYSDFRGCEIHQVPVLRVFGLTPAGQKCCLHVHGVFPYLVIICDDTMPQSETDADFRRFAQELAISIDKALNASTRSTRHHVYKIAFISGIPFYGYHGRSRAFMKIYFYNPNVIRKVAELLSTGAVMNKVIQPYEAHIPYILQFFIDYNLFGMNLIDISKWTFRVSNDEDADQNEPLPSHPTASSQGATGGQRIWNVAQIDNSQVCSSLRRHTCCELEIDCTAVDIQNRSQGQLCRGKNPGLQMIWQEECRRQGRLDTSEILPSCSNDRTDVFETDSEVFYQRRLDEMLTRFEDISSVTVADDEGACSSAHGSLVLSNKSTGETSLCDSQDYEMLNMFLSMVNDTTDNPDHDSILSFHTIRNAEMDDDEAAQTMEMSQCFSDDSDIPSSIDMERTGCRPKRSPLRFPSGATEDLPIIPQLDGTGDDDKLKLVAKRSDILVAPKQAAENKRISRCSPMTATQERMISVEPTIKTELESEEEITCEQPNAMWDHYKKRHRHKSLPHRKGKKNSVDAINNGTFSLDNMFASSSIVNTPSSYPDAFVNRRCSFDSNSEKKITKLTSKRTKARKKRCSSFNCISGNIKTEHGQIDVELPELIRNVDMTKIGREVVLIRKLSESEVKKALKQKKIMPEINIDIAEPDNVKEDDCFNLEAKSSDLDVSPSGSIPKSPSLKMKFKLKRISTRSNDSHIIVVDKEFTEFIDEPEQKEPIKLKLKCFKNKCSPEQSIDGKNFVIDNVPPRRYSHKRHLPLAKKLAEGPQNQNLCFKSPILNDENTPDSSKRRSPEKKSASNTTERKLRSHSAKPDCQIVEVQHPADIQKERLSKLNLILTRNDHDSFNCIQVVDKSYKKSKKKKNSPQKSLPALDLKPTFDQNVGGCQAESDLDEAMFMKQKLPKLHLKLETNDHWTHCKTEPDGEEECKTRSKSPRKRGRRRKSHRKTTKHRLPHCSPTKNTSLKIDPSLNGEVVVSHESRMQKLKKLCKPFSITLDKLTDHTLAKYAVSENLYPEVRNHHVADQQVAIKLSNGLPSVRNCYGTDLLEDSIKPSNEAAKRIHHRTNLSANADAIKLSYELATERNCDVTDLIETVPVLLKEVPAERDHVTDFLETAPELVKEEVPAERTHHGTDLLETAPELLKEVPAERNHRVTDLLEIAPELVKEVPAETNHHVTDLSETAPELLKEVPAETKHHVTDLLGTTPKLVKKAPSVRNHHVTVFSENATEVLKEVPTMRGHLIPNLLKDATDEEPAVRNRHVTDLSEDVLDLSGEIPAENKHCVTDFQEVVIGPPNKALSTVMAMEESSRDSVASFRLMEDKSPNSQSDDLEACFSDTSPMPSKEDIVFRSGNFSSRFIPKVSQDNDDVMWNLAYFSPTEKAHHFDSPPRCWSPSSEVECIREAEKSVAQLPNQIKIKVEPLDSSNDVSSPSDNQIKKIEGPSINDDESLLDFISHSDSKEVCDNTLISENVNVSIKKEAFTDYLPNEGFNSFGDLFPSASSPTFPFLDENSNSIQIPQNSFSQDNLEVKEKSSFNISSQLQHDDVLESCLGGCTDKHNSIKMSADNNYKNSLLYERLSGDKHESSINSIKLEKNSQNKSSCSLVNNQSSQEKSDVFNVLPPIELSFYSTLDDDIIPLDSLMAPSKKLGATNDLDMFNIKEEQNDSCDLFGSDIAEASFQQTSYENISSSSECYMSDYLGLKGPIISDHCLFGTKPPDNKDNSTFNDLIDDFSENTCSESCNIEEPFIPSRMHSTLTTPRTKDLLHTSEMGMKKYTPWLYGNVKDSVYSGSRNIKGRQADDFLHGPQSSIFQQSFDPITSSLPREQLCSSVASISVTNQAANSQDDRSGQQKATHNLSRAPNCVLVRCKVEKPDPQLEGTLETLPSVEENFDANVFSKSKGSCENIKFISQPVFSVPASSPSSWNSDSNSLKKNKASPLLPNILSAPPIMKLQSPFDDDFLQPNKSPVPSVEDEDILSKLVKSCHIDMEFECVSNFMKNQRENEDAFLEMSRDSTRDSTLTFDSGVVAPVPDVMQSAALKKQEINFSNKHNISFSPPMPQPSNVGLILPCDSSVSDKYQSDHLSTSSKSFNKEDFNTSFLSSFDDEIHSFYGNDTLGEGSPTFDIDMSSQHQLDNKALTPSNSLPCNDPASKLGKLSKKRSKQAKVNSKTSSFTSSAIRESDSILNYDSAPSRRNHNHSWKPSIKPPSRDLVTEFIPFVKHLNVFYSEPADCQHSAVSHSLSKVKSRHLLDVPIFESNFRKPLQYQSNLSFNLEEEATNNPCYRTLFAGNNNVILTPSIFTPSFKDVNLWLQKQIKPQILIGSVANFNKKTNFRLTNKTEDIIDIPCKSQTKYSMLTKLLESPIKGNSFNHKRHSLVPASSTPFTRSFNGACKKEPEQVQEGSISSTSGTTCPAPPLSRGFSQMSSIKKRKLSFTEATGPFASKAIKIERLSPKPQYLLPSSSLNSTSSQIEGPTLENSGAFKINLGNQDCSKSHKLQYLTVMSIEVHINTRDTLCPDPQHDPVTMVFFCISKDDEKQCNKVGVIAVGDMLRQEDFHASTNMKQELLATPGISQDLIFCVCDEIQLFEKLKAIVRTFDPEILLGYEIQKLSLGYLCKRASFLNIDLSTKLSRLIEMHVQGKQTAEKDLDRDGHSDLHIVGRIILNLWRIMRTEVTLNIYTFENVYYHVLHQRVPLFSFQTLTNWYCSRQQPLKYKVLQYYILRVTGNIKLMERLDVIQQTSELARVFGIQFYEVFSRGSQFRVESMMLRYAKSLNYIPISPSVRQRSMSRAPECVPLVFEPESKFYVDPVVVLDFQSLYPSMMIAYNYCFSTCLGRVDNFCKPLPFEFGCCSLSVTPDLLRDLKDSIHIAPTGVAFVKSNIRQGILPSMLSDILTTRILVKKSLKLHKDNKLLGRLLEARQLGLKLIANVTYGYTSANFSGRMPCVEIADSIVAKGRETLERAIRVIESSDKWKAKVVYGDTDSVFILLSGRTKEQAFEIGQEIADAITAMNPKPVKLKFEKVYFPCVLQSKKRYVGYMYETVDQSEPIFDAKGIETVRRDSCAAVGKMLEKSLKILFNSKDVSLVKKYVQKQFGKILSGRMNMMDCIFAKEFRGRSGYRPGACVPALEIAKKRLLKDSQSEPLVGERVPYVVVYGSPGLPIIQLVREPGELLDDPSLRINAKYYITRVISPPLDRVLSLIKADVKQWYERMSHTHVPALPMVPVTNRPRSTLSQYFTALSCPSCEKPTNFGLCPSCQRDCQTTAIILNNKIKDWERSFHHLNEICTSCIKNRNCEDSCISLDCPILYRKNQARKDLAQAPYLRNILLHELF